jgi:ribonuclease HII
MKCIRGADSKELSKSKRENASEMVNPKRGTAPGCVNSVIGEYGSPSGTRL